VRGREVGARGRGEKGKESERGEEALVLMNFKGKLFRAIYD
jgi:hypothetical protein